MGHCIRKTMETGNMKMNKKKKKAKAKKDSKPKKSF